VPHGKKSLTRQGFYLQIPDRRRQERDEIRGLIGSTLAQGVPELFLVEEEYRLTLLKAETEFVEEFIGKITDTRAGWGAEWARFHDEHTVPLT
jgi:hypothetical protein